MNAINLFSGLLIEQSESEELWIVWDRIKREEKEQRERIYNVEAKRSENELSLISQQHAYSGTVWPEASVVATSRRLA